MRLTRPPNQRFQLLLGTNNAGKIHEFKALLINLPVQLVTPDQISISLDITEDGSTYFENASKKAIAWAQRTGLVTLADDTGLEVAALNGAPGLFSHRFTGNPSSSDAEKRRYLIRKLQGIPRPWKARFVCSAVIAFPNQHPISSFGECPGEIIPNERGGNGFGYDPVFLVTSKGCTMAELSAFDKNRVSHRAHAIQAILPILKERMLMDSGQANPSIE